ncbi:wiskott-Aldrich syndrome protein homolog 1-like, partial [Pollicipes pollicipes]|uniref:wiskott-Aldrich syndrome protein homolog 1-like n=1 Tax=Pollicipes pollicipes TaxID=41117 RepID=UPI001884C857
VTSVPVPDLWRTVDGGTVRISRAVAADPFPPGRVTDLRAETDPARATIVFSWTAPGADFDRPGSKVSHYEVRFSESRAQLRDHFTDCTSVPHWSQPEPAGTPSRAVIDFHTVDKLLFFAIRGVDAAGNVAPISNAVALVLPAPPPPPSPPPPTGTTSPVQPTPPPFDSRLLLIGLLCVAGLIVLLVLLAMYYFLVYRRKKPAPDSRMRGYVNTVALASELSREPTPVKVAYGSERNGFTPVEAHNPGLTRWGVTDTPPALGFEPHRSGTPPHQPPGRWGASDTPPTPGLGAHHHSGLSAPGVRRARYNSYQTPYDEDMVPDGRSLDSTPPVGSQASLASDGRPVLIPCLPPPAGPVLIPASFL